MSNAFNRRKSFLTRTADWFSCGLMMWCNYWEASKAMMMIGTLIMSQKSWKYLWNCKGDVFVPAKMVSFGFCLWQVGGCILRLLMDYNSLLPARNIMRITREYRTFQLMLFKIRGLLLKYWQLKVGFTDAYHQYSLGSGVQMFKLLYKPSVPIMLQYNYLKLTVCKLWMATLICGINTWSFVWDICYRWNTSFAIRCTGAGSEVWTNCFAMITSQWEFKFSIVDAIKLLMRLKYLAR